MNLGHHPDPQNTQQAIDCLKKIVQNHLMAINQRYGLSIPPKGKLRRQFLRRAEHQLYRIFYYDAPPFEGRATKPVSRHTINFKDTQAAVFRREFFKLLKEQRGLALRMGKLAAKGEWLLN